jgi:hypothetical protein
MPMGRRWLAPILLSRAGVYPMGNTGTTTGFVLRTVDPSDMLRVHPPPVNPSKVTTYPSTAFAGGGVTPGAGNAVGVIT